MRIIEIKTRLANAAHHAVSKTSYVATGIGHPLRKPAMDAIRRARSVAFSATLPIESFEIYNIVKVTESVPGDMAEVGVFRGGSAALILEATSHRRLHLCDTFAGLPTGGDSLEKGDYAASLPSVQAALSKFSDRTIFHKGMFPADTGHEISDQRFSFVHLDMDLYEGTLGALHFFGLASIPAESFSPTTIQPWQG
jgi:hypothetical protein